MRVQVYTLHNKKGVVLLSTCDLKISASKKMLQIKLKKTIVILIIKLITYDSAIFNDKNVRNQVLINWNKFNNQSQIKQLITLSNRSISVFTQILSHCTVYKMTSQIKICAAINLFAILLCCTYYVLALHMYEIYTHKAWLIYI